MKLFQYFLAVLLFCTVSCKPKSPGDRPTDYNVLIVGGGASGVAAGLQSARLRAKTLIIEPTEWIGGMLTAAGVSAVDGNHNLPSGIWGEFRDSLIQRYGSLQALATGWVSNTLFDPKVGQEIFTNMVDAEPNLTVLRKTDFLSVYKSKDFWKVQTNDQVYHSKILIDATELGDVLAYLNLPSDIGMKDKEDESLGPDKPNNIIQDLTWVAILEDFGESTDKTIKKPANYDPSEFDCACNTGNPPIEAVDCDKMLQYAKLPGGKYMINWPNCGNDIYLNVIKKNKVVREKNYEDARQMTLRFIYYIQSELGYKNLGISTSIFPTKHGLALIPYHRESRRLHGKVRLLSKHLATPYEFKLYRTGIAVGDYPIDHHHKKNPKAPKIDFIGIKIPAYSLPLGTLLPEEMDNIIVAEKSISVSNIVNGTTRLQPVVLGIGQAAGALAASAIEQDIDLSDVKVRTVQKHLLEAGVYLQPFMDVDRADPDFKAIQKAGTIGILKGTGIPYKWANQMWVHPDSLMTYTDLSDASKMLGQVMPKSTKEHVSMEEWLSFIRPFSNLEDEATRAAVNKEVNENGFLTRRSVARLVENQTQLFERNVDFQGNFIVE